MGVKWATVCLTCEIFGLNFVLKKKDLPLHNN